MNFLFRIISFLVLLTLGGCAHQAGQLPNDKAPSKSENSAIDSIQWTVLNRSGTPKTGEEKVEYGDVGRSDDLVSFKRRLTTQSAGIQTVTQTVEEVHCIQKNYRILSGQRRITLNDGTSKLLTFDGSLDWKPLNENSVGRGGMALFKTLCNP